MGWWKSSPCFAVPSSRYICTSKPRSRGKASFSVILNVISSPSVADASSMVRANALSSSWIVPVAVSVAVIVAVVPETVRLTVNVSSGSTSHSGRVATVKVCVSPAVPAKLRAAVFSV